MRKNALRGAGCEFIVPSSPLRISEFANLRISESANQRISVIAVKQVKRYEVRITCSKFRILNSYFKILTFT